MKQLQPWFVCNVAFEMMREELRKKFGSRHINSIGSYPIDLYLRKMGFDPGSDIEKIFSVLRFTHWQKRQELVPYKKQGEYGLCFLYRFFSQEGIHVSKELSPFVEIRYPKIGPFETKLEIIGQIVIEIARSQMPQKGPVTIGGQSVQIPILKKSNPKP